MSTQAGSPASEHPVTLVTGTSSGIGLHAAVELARRGHTVVATMRDTARSGALEEAARAAGVTLDVRALDVVDHEAARACVEAVVADHGRLDVLLNNAGRGAVATAEQLTVEQVRDQLELNYVAPVHLTQVALPHLRARGGGRVLTVTSVGGVVGQPFADAYCGAKFAVEGFMQSLAPVAQALGVWVSVVEPAAVASDFVGNVDRPAAGSADGNTDGNTDGGDAADVGDPYAGLLGAYLERTAGAFDSAQSAQDAGVAVADACTATAYRFRWQTSEAAERFVGLSLGDLDGERVLGATRTWLG
ncbi:short-subunit dehydrogenase [Terracoccus luteus]|uniref:Short-subunit dehydrogenase n=1 Tax=Terracoccus luteus TaxID=53356 RepID=A0A495XZK0_9MICO|nr:SDR family NAD(P)-dependent oxidoreductase [Terracoccus luteus]RKT80040.1 short-subunit dehydrogenase [Terracoccus luteus]